MAATQLNVRMDSSLKAEGDRALARIGYTPSDAVRALWSFARRHAADPHTLRTFLNHLETDEEETCYQSETDIAAQVQRLRAELYDRIGIPFHAETRLETAASSDDLQEQINQDRQLLMEAYAERFAERGL